jgi:outer membrane protein OmpA-like peptidoglycan-associated protein
MEGCMVSAVDVTGLADAMGDPAASHRLAEQRTETVTKTLARYGFSQVMFHPANAGEVGSLTRRGLVRPMRRRVDLTFHLKPPA